MIEEAAQSCPFCNSKLSGPGPLRGRFERHRDDGEEKVRSENRFLSVAGYILITVLVGAGSFLGGMFFWRPQTDYRDTSPPRQEKFPPAEEKDQQIRGLESQLSQLRKELDESSQKIVQLEARLRMVPPPEQKAPAAAAQADKPAAPAAAARDVAPSKPPGPPPSSAWRRPAEPGSYELVRTTFVFEEPTESARRVATVPKGTRVTVVASAGEWLEVRSRRGNPPGYIRRSDAMFIERADQEPR